MRKSILLALAALLCGFQVMTAIPAYPGRIEYVQPDGTKIVLRQHGDEFAHWTTDAAGRLVSLSSDGYYRPASGISVTEILRQGAARRAAARQHRAALRASSSPVALGKKHFLVILVEFTNKQFSTSEDPNAAFTALLNEPGYSVNGGTGSARDYYYENSHGVFEPVFDVFGPVKMDTTYAYYGQNDMQGNDKRPEEAIIEGCKKLDADIDFSRYDNDGDGKVDLVFMYYAGKGEADGGASNTIWPHQWELSSAGKSLELDGKVIDSYACTNEVSGIDGKMCGIGTACHEFGHAMGLPDFYDTDYETNGQAAGLFFFSAMDSGSYNNNGRTPPYFNFHGLVVYHVDKSNRTVKLSYGSTTARDLWDNWGAYNSINENGSHPCFYVVPAADPGNLLYGHFLYAGSYYFNDEYSPDLPFPGSKHVTGYTPVSWNGVEGAVSFSQIAYADNQVTLTVTIPYDGVDYPTIADSGSYRAGDRFNFSLVCPEALEAPASVVWYYDDEPAGADSVTLTAGPHTVDARLTYADGRQAVISLEITVQ